MTNFFENNISSTAQENKTILTIGTFDGVHIGHQKIIEDLVQHGKESNLIPTLLTFFPHPRMVLQRDADIKLINTLEEKKAILDAMGLGNIIVHPFTREFSRLTAVEFVRDILVNELHVAKLIIGYDHRFGRNRTASVRELVDFGHTFGFEVEEIPAQEIDQVSVSSTKIRTALEEGNVSLANKYLGYEFLLTGTIVEGKKLGRSLDYPTANLQIGEAYKLIPRIGAYIVRSLVDGKQVFGMMNIGYNPTVSGNKCSIEVHFFDYDGNLYGQKIQVRLLERLRNEHKFDSVDALREQLTKDKERALKYINAYKIR